MTTTQNTFQSMMTAHLTCDHTRSACTIGAKPATYTQPVTQTRIPCTLVSRQTAPSGRPTATIVISAEHSGMGVDVDLTVADRSVVTA